MNKKIRIFIALLLSAAAFSGCGTNENSKAAEKSDSAATSATELTYALSQLNGGLATIPESIPTSDGYEIPQNEALDFVRSMKVGWNLGNTFDANVDGGLVENDLDLESSWCSVKTTKNLIDNVKNAGFNTVRIPISWHNHVDDKQNISPEFLNRIQEVVDYVIDNDMYCIINIHHDIGKDAIYPSSECLADSEAYMKAIWKQVGEKFADYDSKLIFESINEPRLKDTNYEWNFVKDNKLCLDSVDCINKLNQTFVDTVRASGGNNADRYLMVPGYCASVDGAIVDEFKLPDDKADNRIIVSVHAYTPYNFALADLKNGTNEWSLDNASNTNDILSFMDKLYNKFISKGTPVVIGEFGARSKNDNLQARVDYSAFYVANARNMGMTCCWWDNKAL